MVQDELFPSTPTVDSAEHRYPNAGHQGLSSSATIYSLLPTGQSDTQGPSPSLPTPSTPGAKRLSSKSLKQQISVLQDAFALNADGLKHLIEFWLARGVHLGLSDPFIDVCAHAMQRLLGGKLFPGKDMVTISQTISENSTRPLATSSTSSLEDLNTELSKENVRWESLALVMMVAGRATIDIPFFPPLYKSRLELRTLQQTLTDLSDRCLELALSLDCLNEFQLICQYESFVLHSLMDGDQSKLSCCTERIAITFLTKF